MKEITTLIEIAFARLRNFLGFSKSTEPIPKGVYCYRGDKVCKYFRGINSHTSACTFTGFYGFDPGHNDQCKICSENMGWDEEN